MNLTRPASVYTSVVVVLLGLSACGGGGGGGGPVFVSPETEAMIEQAAAKAYERGLQECRRRGLAELQLGTDSIRAALASSLTEARRIHETNAAETLEAAVRIAEFVLGHAAHDD